MSAARERWLKKRRKGVGSSDIAAIMGLSKWATAKDVWLDKMGLSEDVDAHILRIGRIMEPVICKLANERLGKTYKVVNKLARMDHAPLLATVDALTSDGDLLELKNTRNRWDALPIEYYIQCQHQMLVTGRKTMRLVSLHAGVDLQIWEIDADDWAQTAILCAAVEFWQTFVLPQTPPPAMRMSDIRDQAQSNTTCPTATEDQDELIWQWRHKKADMDALKPQLDALAAKVCESIGGNEGLTTLDGSVVTWKADKNGKRTLRFRED